MNEYDNSDEGLVVADLFFDLYDDLVRICFAEKQGLLMQEEVKLIDNILTLVYNHNNNWMDFLVESLDEEDQQDD
jgi:hypothetical protein